MIGVRLSDAPPALAADIVAVAASAERPRNAARGQESAAVTLVQVFLAILSGVLPTAHPLCAGPVWVIRPSVLLRGIGHSLRAGNESRNAKRSDQMRLRTLAVALAVAGPLLVLESAPAAAFGWCGWGYGSSGYTAPRTYGYVAPRRYGYVAPRRYGYAPRYYGGSFYGRRLGLRGYGYRGWRGYGYRAGWRGYRAGWGGARVVGRRAAVRAVRR